MNRREIEITGAAAISGVTVALIIMALTFMLCSCTTTKRLSPEIQEAIEHDYDELPEMDDKLLKRERDMVPHARLTGGRK